MNDTATLRVSDRLLRETQVGAPPQAAVNAAAERRLRVYSIDPTGGAQRGGVVTLAVPYELLEPFGERFLIGGRFGLILPPAPHQAEPELSVEELAEDRRRWFDTFSLEKPQRLVEQGFAPSLSDPPFIAQMVYAVAMSLDGVFRDALGRLPVLGVERAPCDGDADPSTGDVVRACRSTDHAAFQGRLILAPWASNDDAQAWFDQDSGAVQFGAYKAKGAARGYPPDSMVYTALSHDVIVHEVSHAYLDSIQPHLGIPVTGDGLAFHEAFADLMVVFQRMTYPELVKGQMAKARGRPGAFELLATLATGFAQTTSGGRTLRTIRGEAKYADVGYEPHERGAVLVQAVYRAFLSVIERRIDRIVAIATGGNGLLPEGQLPPVLIDEMARITGKTARMFQSMLIRALDYCPPLGISYADFLCAAITADLRLVPMDDEGVREAWMEAFRFHGIFPSQQLHFSEESLTGSIVVTDAPPPAIAALSFSQTRFSSQPGMPMSLERAVDQASKVSQAVRESSAWAKFFGARFDLARPIEIVSIRSFARPGPRRMTEFGTVVQLLQPNGEPGGSESYLGAAAATLLFDSEGAIATCAVRPTGDQARLDEARRYTDSFAGRMAWTDDTGGGRTLARNYMRKLCS